MQLTPERFDNCESAGSLRAVRRSNSVGSA